MNDKMDRLVSIICNSEPERVEKINLIIELSNSDEYINGFILTINKIPRYDISLVVSHLGISKTETIDSFVHKVMTQFS